MGFYVAGGVGAKSPAFPGPFKGGGEGSLRGGGEPLLPRLPLKSHFQRSLLGIGNKKLVPVFIFKRADSLLAFRRDEPVDEGQGFLVFYLPLICTPRAAGLSARAVPRP